MIEIKVLGSGCLRCNELAENAREAISITGIEAEVIKVSDLSEIAEYEVRMTPALVIDEDVKSVGKIISAAEIARLINAMG